MKNEIDVPKNDGLTPAYTPSHSEIENALVVKQAMRSLFCKGNHEHLSVEHKKFLSSFSFGSDSFMLAPQQSNRVISCIYDPTDIAGMTGQASTSSSSLKFFIDNHRMQIAGWACEASLFREQPDAGPSGRSQRVRNKG